MGVFVGLVSELVLPLTMQQSPSMLFTIIPNHDIVSAMERFMWMVRSTKRYAFDVRVLYALVGIVVSIGAHELVHVLMNLGSINTIHFFPNPETMVSMDILAGHSVLSEEIIAYTVTVLIQFVAIIDVFAIHDSRDKKSAGQSLYGNLDDLSENDSTRLLQLVSK